MTSTRAPVPWVRLGLLAGALLEVAVAISVGEAVGAGWTLLALVVLSLLGLWVLAREGRLALTAFAQAASGAPDPDGVLRPGDPRERAPRTATGVAAGLLLVVPGFLSGALGLLLLVPGVRGVAGRRLERFLTTRARPVRTVPGETVPDGGGAGGGGGAGARGEIVVSEVIVEDLPPLPDDPPPR